MSEAIDVITEETEVSTTELACVLGITGRRIRQMAEDGQLQKVSKGRFLLADSVQRYVKFLSDGPMDEEDKKLEKTRRVAETTMKASKATIAKLEAEELKGTMHRAEDVAALTEDLVYTIRGALNALPGRLAVDVAAVSTPAEASEVIIDDAANKKRYFYIADKAKSGFTKHPGSGKYVGRYNTISGHYSKTGAAPLVNLTRASARSGARGKGSKWSEYDFASWCAVWLLYLVEFSDWDSQSKIGRGYVDGNSSAISSGGTDSMTYHTGRAAGTDGKTAVQYRHIENPYGNVFEWIDGINFSDGAVYICLNPASYADDTANNYTNIGTKIQNNGYISAIGVAAAMPWAFYPTAVGGSETTYIPDYAYYDSGWRVLHVGGSWNDGGYAGLFYFYALNSSSDAYSGVGARLLFHP